MKKNTIKKLVLLRETVIQLGTVTGGDEGGSCWVCTTKDEQQENTTASVC